VDGVVLSPVAAEMQRGFRAPDRLASLIAVKEGNGDAEPELSHEEGRTYGLGNRTKLVFRYTVCSGDHSDDLE